MKIICHMIMSADGRLISKYWSPLYNNSSDVSEVYEAVASKNAVRRLGSSAVSQWPNTVKASLKKNR